MSLNFLGHSQVEMIGVICIRIQNILHVLTAFTVGILSVQFQQKMVSVAFVVLKNFESKIK